MDKNVFVVPDLTRLNPVPNSETWPSCTFTIYLKLVKLDLYSLFMGIKWVKLENLARQKGL